jgi:uncharacterized membrane protein
MQFASPIPWWLAALVAAGICAVAYLSYRRPLVPLARSRRFTLIALRALALGSVVFFLCRPVLLKPPTRLGDLVVPILVDVSRSMRVADADGQPRLDRAIDLIRATLKPALETHARVELFAVADGIVPASVDALRADGRKSDLKGAVAAVRDRFRGQRVPGIVLLTDGGDTGASALDPIAPGAPVFAVGIGSANGVSDRELLSIAAADPRLDQTSVDVHVVAASHGFGRAAFQLRLLADGVLVESRQVTPLADGSPVDESFVVSPDPSRATVFTAQISAEPADAVPENDSRSLLVSPTGRKRRVLLLAGAPGYDYSFMGRALGEDRGLEIDSIVRKGKNDQNVDTFLVQAGGGRAATLTSGFPATKEALFGYDAVVIANLEGDFFARAQLLLLADFVGERGGGLLVMGGRSFDQRGLTATPLEPVLPVELNDRRGMQARQAPLDEAPAPRNAIVVTPEGQNHPVMRIGASAADTKKLWETLPTLSAVAPLGGARPGATVLAVAAAPSGAIQPVIAVQRYGRGRSMVFGGEASWRWRMLEPAADRRYEFFWRQSLRWLTTEAPDPVMLTVPSDLEAGDTATIGLDVRDRSFTAVPQATVAVTITPPSGEPRALPVRPVSAGRFAATYPTDANGLYRLHAEATQGTVSLGSADRWVYVGGSDRELVEPRLNEGWLRRLARESGGAYVAAADIARVVPALQDREPATAPPERRDLWHEPWAFALVIGLVASEWVLRRLSGLR